MLRRLLWALPLILGCWMFTMGVDCEGGNVAAPVILGMGITVSPAASTPDDLLQIRGLTSGNEAVTATRGTLALYPGPLPSPLPLTFETASGDYESFVPFTGEQNSSASLPTAGRLSEGTYHVLLFARVTSLTGSPAPDFPDDAPRDVFGYQFVVSDCGAPFTLAGAEIPDSAVKGEINGISRPSIELLSGRVGESYSQSVATQFGGGVAPLRYTLLRRDGLYGVNLSSSGMLTGTPTPSSAGNHRLTIQVTDSCSPPRKQTFSADINIVANPGFCTELLLPSAVKTDGVVGSPFTQNIVVSGGKAPVSLNVSSGALPGGLTLSGNTISGTPTVAGTFVFNLTAQDSCDIRQSVEQNYRIDITDPDPCPNMSRPSASLPDGFVGSAYSHQLTVVGGVPPLSYALNPASTLPDGLFVDGNGLISGTPTTITTGQAFTVIVTDSCVPPQEFPGIWSIEIQDAEACPTLSLSGILPDATAGVDYDIQLNAIGRAPFTYTKVSGDLPFGLGLSPSGRIQGLTFDAGIYNFDVRVVDSCPAGARELTRSMSLRVTGPSCANLAIVTFDLVQGFEGAAYSDFIDVLGGEGTLNYQVMTGALPAGLTLNQFGEISGIAGAAGTFDFTVRVTDSCSVVQEDQQAYTLIINGTGCPGMEIDGTDLPDASAGTPYSFIFEMFGGQGAITWMFYFASTPPPGLTLDPVTGELSGTPTTPGTYFFDIEATDECNPPQHAYRSVTLVIN